MCQAYGCSNRVSKRSQLGFFSIPDPRKEPQRCRIWLKKIGTDKFNLKTYTYSKNRVVCEEHFEPDCIENALATELGFAKRKQLKPGSIPTIFTFPKNQKRDPAVSGEVKKHREDR
ncbi:hypothetical protein BSL78_24835 [Apostichopus japonicus]|uniref:THAP-type domain-containing protein n=1 Tax=Stichopus japonicus TaxID=307972 RepID=A0A2G8JRC4_STIJA|nr:hypothetical protein BSL78_24835 [Apostichopus japonicus]